MTEYKPQIPLCSRLRALKGGNSLSRPNWDSYGADPIAPDTFDAAIEVAKAVSGVLFAGQVINMIDFSPDGSIELSNDSVSILVRHEA